MSYNRSYPPSRSAQQRGETVEDHWPGYLNGGYFEKPGVLKPEFVRRGEMTRLANAMSNGTPSLTSTQLRRFFGHARAIESTLLAGTSTWEQQRANFLKLDEAAADASGKEKAKIPDLFHDFIQRNVAAVKNEQDFLKGFVPHFEALIGFGSQVFRERR